MKCFRWLLGKPNTFAPRAEGPNQFRLRNGLGLMRMEIGWVQRLGPVLSVMPNGHAYTPRVADKVLPQGIRQPALSTGKCRPAWYTLD
jgi:hypothetical protein